MLCKTAVEKPVESVEKFLFSTAWTKKTQIPQLLKLYIFLYISGHNADATKLRNPEKYVTRRQKKVKKVGKSGADV